MNRKLIVLQEGNKDCGAACLLSIIRYYGGDISLNRLIDITKTTKEGTNFYSLSDASNKLGLISSGYKVDDIAKLNKISAPFIAQLNINNYNHFVVVYKIDNNKILIMDPSKGKVNMDIFDFSNMWTGYIMLFEKKIPIPYFKNEKELNKIIIFTITRNIKNILFVLILSLIFTMLSCLISLYSQIVFDKVIGTDTNNLIIVTIIFSILILIKNITNFIRNYLLVYLNQKLDISIILSTFSKIVLLPYRYFKNKTTGEVLSRINDLYNIKTFISKIIIIIFLDLLLFIFSSIIIYNINSKILIMLFIISFTYILIILIFNPIIKRISNVNIENTSKMNNIIIESISSFETIKGLNIEDNTILKFSKAYTNTLNNAYYNEKISNIVLLLKDLIKDIGLLLISFISIKYIMDNNLTIGSYLTITLLSTYVIYPIKNILDILNEYHYIKNTIKRANNLLEVPSEDFTSDNKLEVSGNIIIKNLSYTYDNKNNILDNISFYIKDKEKVLILGPSGIGKSTILKLLYKYLECDRKKIFINNYDINDFNLNDIRKNITYTSQNEMLYSDTIENNIILNRNIDKEKYLNVLKITYIDDIIKDNPLGYNYMLEENGVNISGGQRQRIILARSLLKNSKIIMIDEGFNQIDINLERKILKNIFYYFKDKTIIIISHRKENIDLYDRVIKLSNNGAINLERRK